MSAATADHHHPSFGRAGHNSQQIELREREANSTGGGQLSLPYVSHLHSRRGEEPPEEHYCFLWRQREIEKSHSSSGWNSPLCGPPNGPLCPALRFQVLANMTSRLRAIIIQVQVQLNCRLSRPARTAPPSDETVMNAHKSRTNEAATGDLWCHRSCDYLVIEKAREDACGVGGRLKVGARCPLAFLSHWNKTQDPSVCVCVCVRRRAIKRRCDSKDHHDDWAQIELVLECRCCGRD